MFSPLIESEQNHSAFPPLFPLCFITLLSVNPITISKRIRRDSFQWRVEAAQEGRTKDDLAGKLHDSVRVHSSRINSNYSESLQIKNIWVIVQRESPNLPCFKLDCKCSWIIGVPSCGREWFTSHLFSSLVSISQVVLVVKNLPANAEVRDLSLIPGSGKSPGGGHGDPLQYSCLENPMDRGAWWATVHGVSKSQTWLKWLST